MKKKIVEVLKRIPDEISRENGEKTEGKRLHLSIKMVKLFRENDNVMSPGTSREKFLFEKIEAKPAMF